MRDALDAEHGRTDEPVQGSLAKAARALVVELGRSARSFWHLLPRLVSVLLVWIGTPVAVAVFGVSVAYHLLGGYSTYQTEIVTRAKVRVKKLVAERNNLLQELEEARAETAQAKDEVETANREITRLTVERDQLRMRAPLADSSTGGGETVLAGAGAAAGSKRAVSMPCELPGASREIGSKLRDCVEEFDRRNGG